MSMPVPQPTFAFLVLSMRAQCEMQLGLMHFGGEEEKPEPNLDLARHTIDLMAILQEKTRGNLTLEEQRMLENSVTELRFQIRTNLRRGGEGGGTESLNAVAPLQDHGTRVRNQRGRAHDRLPLRRVHVQRRAR